MPPKPAGFGRRPGDAPNVAAVGTRALGGWSLAQENDQSYAPGPGFRPGRLAPAGRSCRTARRGVQYLLGHRKRSKVMIKRYEAIATPAVGNFFRPAVSGQRPRHD